MPRLNLTAEQQRRYDFEGSEAGIKLRRLDNEIDAILLKQGWWYDHAAQSLLPPRVCCRLKGPNPCPIDCPDCPGY